jgi:hypothetical protein
VHGLIASGCVPVPVKVKQGTSQVSHGVLMVLCMQFMYTTTAILQDGTSGAREAHAQQVAVSSAAEWIDDGW